MDKNDNFTIALTGGIGSGKSTVGDLFKKLGIHVLDADHVVHELMGPDSPLGARLKQHFGDKVINTDNSINRSVLGDIVFHDPQQRAWLEKLIHPSVYAILWERSRRFKSPYCIMLIPLLFESHRENEFDHILVIDTPEALQLERVKQRSNFDEAKVRQIIASQVPRDERLIKANDVIDNSGDMTLLERQVLSLHEKYKLLAENKSKSR